MDVKQLKAVLAVAKHLSFVEAGLDTCFSTSAVSKQVSSLEQELGVCLFFRKGKSKVSITPEGSSLLPFFQKMSDEYNAMAMHLKTFEKSNNEKLVIASPQIFPPNIETGLLGEFIKDHPDISLSVTHCYIGQMIDMLYGGKVDLCIESILGRLEDNPALFRLAEDPNLVSLPFTVSEDFIMMHPQNPLASRKSVSIADLSRYHGNSFLFISCYPENPSIRKSIFLRECSKYSFTPKIIDFNYDHGVSAIMAKYISLNPKALAIMPDLDTDFSGTVRVKLDCDAFYPTTMVFYLKSNRSKALKAFVETTKRVAFKYLSGG